MLFVSCCTLIIFSSEWASTFRERKKTVGKNSVLFKANKPGFTSFAWISMM